MALAREMHRREVNVSVAGLRDPWTSEDCRGEGFEVTAAEIAGPNAFGFSPDLHQRLQRLAPPGVIHSHGLWMYPGLAARKSALQSGYRLLISPHGMLEPWALNHSGWKKRLAGLLFENKNLRRADCLHALCRGEADHFRRYGLKNPIAIIPNGVDLDEYSGPPTGVIEQTFPDTKGRRRVLFLSRLHQKKGLSNLLAAWRSIGPDFKGWQLLIAGSGELSYEQELKGLAEGLIRDKSALFLGPRFGRDKAQIFAAADVFVLPSFSEGFSMAILEAAASGLPVLLTRECNFPELAQANGAVEISTDIRVIETGLRQILGLSDEQRKAMGQRGRELVARSYTWSAVAEQMHRVYLWLVGAAPAPETVQR